MLKSCLLILSISLSITIYAQIEELPKFAQKKIDKTLEAIWHDDDIDKNKIKTVGQLENSYLKDKTIHLYKLEHLHKMLGYLYLDNAKSQYETFNYMIIFNPDLSIKHIKVLVYREDYGSEIGSKRWLSQFEGKQNGAQMEFKKDIKNISGATVSSRSISKGIKQASLNMQELKRLGIIPFLFKK